MENDTKDVGFLADAMTYLENAICAETHALSSFATTNDPQWIELAKMIRENRSKYLYMLAPENQGQCYCFMKHIMACAMSVRELGHRFLEGGDKKLAEECFKEASDYEAMFILVKEKGGKK